MRSGGASPNEQEIRYLLILGCTVRGEAPGELLQTRIDRAAQYLLRHPQTVAVASGGCFRRGQRKSEAEVIREGLRAAGISAQRILLEEQARTTAENMACCKRLLTEEHAFDPHDAIAFVTNDFHVRRCQKLAARTGLRPVPVSVPTPARMRLRCLVREWVVSIPLRFSEE